MLVLLTLYITEYCRKYFTCLLRLLFGGKINNYKIIWKGLQLILFTNKNISQKFSTAMFFEHSFAEEKNRMAQHDKNNTQTLFLKTSNTCQRKQHEYWDFASINLLITVHKSL